MDPFVLYIVGMVSFLRKGQFHSSARTTVLLRLGDPLLEALRIHG